MSLFQFYNRASRGKRYRIFRFGSENSKWLSRRLSTRRSNIECRFLPFSSEKGKGFWPMINGFKDRSKDRYRSSLADRNRSVQARSDSRTPYFWARWKMSGGGGEKKKEKKTKQKKEKQRNAKKQRKERHSAIVKLIRRHSRADRLERTRPAGSARLRLSLSSSNFTIQVQS